MRRGRRDRHLPDGGLPRLLRRHGRLLGADRLAERAAGRPAGRPAGRRARAVAHRPGGPTSVTLAPLAGRTGTRALRLTDAEGVDYWLEYRTVDGPGLLARDRRPTATRLQTGVLLHRAGGAARHLPAARRHARSAPPAGTPTSRPRCRVGAARAGVRGRLLRSSSGACRPPARSWRSPRRPPRARPSPPCRRRRRRPPAA